MYHNDFTEPTLLARGKTTEVERLSVKDKRLFLFKEGIVMAGGHYHVPLAQRNPDTIFPNDCNGYQ